MSLDVQKLQQELESIDKERYHVSERLQTLGGRGRPMFPGRGMGPGMGRPPISPRDANMDGPFTNGLGPGMGPRASQNGGFRNAGGPGGERGWNGPPPPNLARQGNMRDRLGDPRERMGGPRDHMGEPRDSLGDSRGRAGVPPYAPGARELPPPPPLRGSERDRRGDSRGDPRADFSHWGDPRGNFRGDHRGDMRGEAQADPRAYPRGDARGDLRDRLDRGKERGQGPGDYGERRAHGDEAQKSTLREAAPETNKRKRLASAVVMDGEQRVANQGFENDAPGIAKRPKLEAEEKPEVKQRNRRLFGALMGTLEAFKKEDKQFASSKAAILREEALKRAEKRKVEEAALARQQERLNLNKQMQAEVVRKRELNAAANAKRLQIMVALRILHHEKLSKFLRTDVGPRLMWQPKQHCPETLALLEARAADFVAFKARELAKMERDSQRLLDLAKPPALRAGYIEPRKQGEGEEVKANGGRANKEEEEDEEEQGEEGEEGEASDDEGREEGNAAEDMETDKDRANENREEEEERQEHEERRAGMGPAEHAGGDRWQADAKSESEAELEDADAAEEPPSPTDAAAATAGETTTITPAEPAEAVPAVAADPAPAADAGPGAEGAAPASAESADVKMAEAVGRGGEGDEVREGGEGVVAGGEGDKEVSGDEDVVDDMLAG